MELEPSIRVESIEVKSLAELKIIIAIMIEREDSFFVVPLSNNHWRMTVNAGFEHLDDCYLALLPDKTV